MNTGLSRRLADLPLRFKLSLLISTALLLSFAAIGFLISVQERQLLEQIWIESIRTQAQLVAYNSEAALAFRDRKTANDILASFAASPVVKQAMIVLERDQVFASYQNGSSSLLRPGSLKVGEQLISDGYLLLSHKLKLDFASGARVEIVASLEEVESAHRRQMLYGMLVLTITYLLANWLALLVGRQISSPLEQLGDLSHQFAADTGITRRCHFVSRDEVGETARAFNRMLDSLQARDAELQKYQQNLEGLVRQRTAELELALTEAQQANQVKSDFLARMSHEIRTPMNAVIGMNSLALSSGLNRQQRNYVEKSLIAAESLLRIINDILDFSRMEQGKLDVSLEPFDLHQSLEQLASILVQRATDKGLRLSFQVDPAVPRLLVGDSIRVGQILLNLCQNAVKFTDHGFVRLTIEPVGSVRQRCQLRFGVRDSGIGIPRDKLAQVFDAFAQAEGSLSRRYEGTGLGLAIVKQLVDLMGGEIGVTSEPGQGSEFVFSILFDRQGGEEPEPHLVPGRRLLAFAATQASADRLAESLAALDGVCDTCLNLEELSDNLSRARAQGTAYDLLLLDLSELERPSAAVMEHLSSLCAVVALISNTQGESLQQQLLHWGMDRVLSHPFTPWSLRRVVGQLLLGDAAQLPAEAGAEPLLAGQVSARHRAESVRLLVVEDNVVNREMMVEYLKRFELQADMVSDGEAAVERALTQAYDLVLMDIQMPILDGLEATRRIRHSKSKDELPIVAMTANVFPEDIARYLQAGMNSHLQKPFRPQELKAVFWRYLQLAPREAAPASVNAEDSVLDGEERELNLPLALNLIDNNRELLLRLMATFRRDHLDWPQSLQHVFAAESSDELMLKIQSLASSALQVGAEQLSRSAQEMEASLRRADQADQEAHLRTLTVHLRRALTFLGRLLEREGEGSRGSA